MFSTFFRISLFLALLGAAAPAAHAGPRGAGAAVDDRFVTAGDGGLTITASALLQNDTQAPASVSSVAIVDPPDHGAVTGGPIFLYTPPTSFVGLDTFTYTWQSDQTGEWVTPATVTVRVGSSFAPVAGAFTGNPLGDLGLFESPIDRFVLCDGHVGFLDCDYYDAPSNPALIGWDALYGDWDGDGTTDVGAYNSASGQVHRFVRVPNTQTLSLMDSTTWVPTGSGPWLKAVAGDWDGDGDDEVALYDPAAERFYQPTGLQDPPYVIIDFTLGVANLQPVAGDWDNDGDVTLGFYAPPSPPASTNGSFYLMNGNGAVETTGTVVGAVATDLPLAVVREPGQAAVVGLLSQPTVSGGTLQVRLFLPPTQVNPYFEESNVAQIPPCPIGEPTGGGS